MKSGMCRISGELLIIVLVLCGSSKSSQAADVAFRWAILAEEAGVMQPLDFSSPPVVHSGTPMQFYLEHLDNCYIYLYLLDAGNQVAALFPMTSGYYTYGFPRGQKFFPPGNRTFTFVPPGGMETFILVATVQRPFQLEKLTDELLKNPESRSQQQLLLGEIEAMIGNGKREKRSQKAEDLVSVERRSSSADGSVTTVSFQAVEVDIGDFYGRKLLIDHR
jgi:hypothetical protein